MRLSELSESYNGKLDPEITGLSSDSRQIKPGWLFAAVTGTRYDGRRFIGDAVAHGAAAVLAPLGTTVEDISRDVALLTHENPRHMLALMAARFYGAQPDVTVAVTGTNGKTSTVDFVRQLWNLMGYKAASMGTLGVRGPSVEKAGTLTTPDPVALQAELADLAAAGITHLAMEASSHGLHQSRLDGVRATAAGFTNLSHEHLDYHNTMEDYLIAKAHLFEDILKRDGVAVLNADIPVYEELSRRVKDRGCKIMSYGYQAEDITLHSVTPAPEGLDFSFTVLGKKHDMTLPLVGDFQVMNVLCALGLVMAQDPENADLAAQAVSHIPGLKGVPGRLELVPGHPSGAVYIDYAHTPDALEHALKALRAHTSGRLLCVIGCGGDRDARKRPLMGKIAADRADIAVITDDNPRHEDPAHIRAPMMAGAQNKAKEIGGREKAIRWAVREMKKDDVLLIAGKGHETGQIIGDETIPFSDREEAEKAIKELSKGKA